LPNLTVLAPGNAADVAPMVNWALDHNGPTAIRYAKAPAETLDRPAAPIELGKAEVYRWGADGVLIAAGALLGQCLEAADHLTEEGFDVGVINARFIKPLDRETILRAVAEHSWTMTVEEGALMGGFGSAVLEAVADAGLNASRIRRLGVPDRFVEHGTRGELLADLKLNAEGIAAACRRQIGDFHKAATASLLHDASHVADSKTAR
jgi:1-deoxy-D-xylulose-5-phosphate synthase